MDDMIEEEEGRRNEAEGSEERRGRELTNVGHFSVPFHGAQLNGGRQVPTHIKDSVELLSQQSSRVESRKT